MRYPIPKVEAQSSSAASVKEVPVPFRSLPVELPEPAGAFSLRDYWRIVHAHRWTVAWAILVGVTAAVAHSYLSTPIYRATGTIQIDREQPARAHLEDDYSPLPEQPDYIETQYKVLQSRSLARRVIRNLGLQYVPELNPAINHDASIPKTDPYHEEEEKPVSSGLVDRFLERLSIDPGKGTRLVRVRFESEDRRLAPKVVNVLAEEYIAYNLEARWNATQRASNWLQQQLTTLKERLESSEKELQDYAANNSILFIEERKDITTEKLAQLEDELTRAEADRIAKQSWALLVEDALRRGADPPASLSSPMYEQFKTDLSQLQRQRAELLVTFVPSHPKLRRVDEKIQLLRESITQEKERLLTRIQEKYEVAVQREHFLRQAVTEQKQRVHRVSDNFIQYGLLKRDAETNRELYEGLLQRLKEAGVSAGLRASNVAVLDPAEIPVRPYRPSKGLNALLGLMGGLLVGIALSLLREHFNTVVQTPEEVEQMTGLRLLAVIPRSKVRTHAKLSTRPVLTRRKIAPNELLRLTGGTAAGANTPGDRAALKWAPEAGLAEAYRTLRSSVLLGWNGAMRRILVTSAQPEEGKTSVSLNLSCSLAQLGRRVLVIDADMRRSNCAEQLGLSPESGLSDYLRGLARLDQVISATSIEGLSLIAGGSSSGVSSDLLYSPRLPSLLKEAGLRFEHVVIDSPPSLVLSDARTISRLVEGVILVISDTTERASLLRTKRLFDDSGVQFLGFAMNRINLDNLDYSYYRDYGYYYSYSEEQGG